MKDDDIECKRHLDARHDSPKQHHQTGGKRLEVIMSVVLGIGFKSLASKDLLDSREEIIFLHHYTTLARTLLILSVI